MSAPRSPVLALKVTEPGIVGRVEGDEDEVIGLGYGGDLSVDQRRGPTGQNQARPFGGVPAGRAIVVSSRLGEPGPRGAEVSA
jgi:hypothetical protein